MPALTTEQAAALQRAFDRFNAELFAGLLPHVLIVLHRHPKANGFFVGDRYRNRQDKTRTASELALNPDHFDRSTQEVLGTFVHEMLHLWQHVCGTPSRGGYHNREWAAKMREVGLIPSDSGQPGGKETGPRVTHYIEQGGRFETVSAELICQGFELRWESCPPDPKAKAKNKVKFCCPSCEQKAWGKPELRIICSECEEEMIAA